ncbi:hypothetical protein ANASTE_01894 [Anaerofustis stercorihominis DSM 17244]|uniref:Uncharacterized protein n=1 Tax=Anaerofustis stercorihominis DSM 17244 TaxID=445971 RepID=B1C9W8_9FIRM|nr:hypothetical protein ANASTE_01894 [Anaerofustis stercorihominis DSM 17244]
MSAQEPPFPVAGCFLPAVNLLCTELAVSGPVGTGEEWLTTDHAAFEFIPEQKLRFQRLIQRQDSTAEPFAEKRIGNTLNADTFLSIVQCNTVAAVIVAAFRYQLTHPSVLRIVHNRNLIMDRNTSFLTVKKHPSTIHFIFEAK